MINHLTDMSVDSVLKPDENPALTLAEKMAIRLSIFLAEGDPLREQEADQELDAIKVKRIELGL